MFRRLLAFVLSLLLINAPVVAALAAGGELVPVTLSGGYQPSLDLNLTSGVSPTALNFSQTTLSTLFANVGGNKQIATNGNFALNPLSPSMNTPLNGWQWAVFGGTSAVTWNGSNVVTLKPDGSNTAQFGTDARTTIPGHTYAVQVTTDGIVNMNAGTSAFAGDLFSDNSGTGAQTFSFVATSTTSYVSFKRTSLANIAISNVSITDVSVLLTYAPNNIITPNFAAWTVQAGATLTAGQSDPDGGTNAASLTVTSTAAIFRVVNSGAGFGVLDNGVWINAGASPSGTVDLQNTQGAASFGNWKINLATLPANTWTWINRNSAALTIATEFKQNSGGGGLSFVADSGTVSFKAYLPVQQAQFVHTAVAQGSIPYTSVSAYFGPRYDYSWGSTFPAPYPELRFEGVASTNLALQSGDLTNAAWTTSGASVANGANDPTGGFAATTITDVATSAAHYVSKAVSVAVSSGATATYSTFLSAGSRRYVTVWVESDNANAFWVTVDTQNWVLSQNNGALGTGSVSGFSGPTYVGTFGGHAIYRVSVTGAVSGQTAYYAGTAGSDVASPTTNLKVYTGNSSTWISWGQQLEPLSFPTFYIPTGASAVTRAADVATVALPAACGLSGLLQANFRYGLPRVTIDSSVLAEVNNATPQNNNYAQLTFRTNGFVEPILLIGGASKFAGNVVNDGQANVLHRHSIAWGTSGYGYYDGGLSSGLVAPGSTPSAPFDQIYIGAPAGAHGNQNHFTGWIDRITAWCPTPANQNFAQQKSISW